MLCLQVRTLAFLNPMGIIILGTVNIKVDSTVIGNIVRVTATLGVRDWSGNFDDDYEGNVYFAVIAE